MMERYLLVDYENVPQVDPVRLADDWRVTIFVGSCQKALPFELVQNVQKLGNRLEWLKVDGKGDILGFLLIYRDLTYNTVTNP